MKIIVVPPYGLAVMIKWDNTDQAKWLAQSVLIIMIIKW